MDGVWPETVSRTVEIFSSNSCFFDRVKLQKFLFLFHCLEVPAKIEDVLHSATGPTGFGETCT